MVTAEELEGVGKVMETAGELAILTAGAMAILTAGAMATLTAGAMVIGMEEVSAILMAVERAAEVG